jgi:Bacterial protein of unknown function (DUF899)
MMQRHPVVSHDEWITARQALLNKEKEFTRLRDELSQQRRHLPWERRRSDRRRVHLKDAADGSAIGKHVVIVIVPLAGRTARGGTFEDQ